LKKLKLYLFSTVLFLICTRIGLRIFLPDTFYVPDESTWSRLTQWIYSGGDNTKLEGFDVTPYFGSQAFVLPSVWQMELLNITSLEAVRNTSFLYGIGGITVMAVMIFRLRLNKNSNDDNKAKTRLFLPVSILLIYGLVPSHALWATLGLRDSAAEFFVMLVCLAIQHSFQRENKRLISSIVILLGILGLSASRAQVAWILCFLLVLTSILSFKLKPRRIEFSVLGLVAFPLCLLISNVPSKSLEYEFLIQQDEKQILVKVENNKVFSIESKGLVLKKVDNKLTIAPKVTKSPSANSTIDESNADNPGNSMENFKAEEVSSEDISQLVSEIEAASNVGTLSGNSTPETTVKVTEKQVREPAITENVTAPLARLENISKERDVKRLYADGVIQEIACPVSTETTIGYLFCEIYRLPYSMTTFLFRPFVFESSTSQEFKYSSIENIFWFFLFVLLLIILLSRKWRPRNYDMPVILFLTLFTPPASLTEGNFGTAVRHKSVTLWAILFLLLSVSSQYEFQTRRRLFSKNKSTS
jgi:hypothetical protein